MATKDIVSILQTLTSDEFVSCGCAEMEALVTEYFTGNDAFTDNESDSDSKWK